MAWAKAQVAALSSTAAVLLAMRGSPSVSVQVTAIATEKGFEHPPITSSAVVETTASSSNLNHKSRNWEQSSLVNGPGGLRTYSHHLQARHGTDPDGFPLTALLARLAPNNAYSAILYVGSLLQITYKFEGRNLPAGHRLAYVPFPFDADRSLVRDIPVVDLVDLYVAEGAESVALRSSVRFDCDAAPKKGVIPRCTLR